jgi:23S rRNA (cytosine1962-C5)-methyltransferase
MMTKHSSRSLPTIELHSADGWQDYALLDSGDGFKLEQFGPFRLVRPEAEAVWRQTLPPAEWKKADALYKPSAEENGGHWEYRQKLPERFKMTYGPIAFWAMTSSSRHLGVFPEQSVQWDWADKVIANSKITPKVLNLFGYTGMASLAAARSGAQVTHLDASRKSVLWAKDNQALSDMANTPIRWIIDDAVKFVQREIRRGVQYDGIILDPPKFGRGPQGEVWEFYKLLPDLLQSCRQILSPNPLFVQLTAYAVKASSVTMYYAIQDMMAGFNGRTQAGEIGLTERSGAHFLSTAIFARWCREDAFPQ